jgi:hypothetical protein
MIPRIDTDDPSVDRSNVESPPAAPRDPNAEKPLPTRLKLRTDRLDPPIAKSIMDTSVPNTLPDPRMERDEDS